MRQVIIYLFLTFLSFQTLFSLIVQIQRFYKWISERVSKASWWKSNLNIKKSFIENIAKENVDINALGLYTLGELRKSLSEENIAVYQKLLKNIF